MRLLPVAVAMIGLAGAQFGAATAVAQSSRIPVLVELFTSEGCSDCPPADRALAHMDAKQPVPGVQIIVLSEHITYFNHLGWTDPYSSGALTDRQYVYAHNLGLKDVFTPQMLLDGTKELWVKNPQEPEQLIREDASEPRVPIQIRSATLDRNGPSLRAQIHVDGTGGTHRVDVYAAVALDHTTNDVRSGENHGQQLTNVAVVRVLKKIGELKKGGTLDTNIALKLPPRAATQPLRLIVFVQQPGQGAITGAALDKNIH